MLVVVALPTMVAAQGGARALGAPTRESAAPPDPRWGAPETDSVQDITPRAPDPHFGDGHEGDVPWSDAELDLRPSGFVHGGILGGGGVLMASDLASMQPDLTLGPFLDFALIPTLSLHLRVAAMFHGRPGDGATLPDGRLGSPAAIVGRGQVLLGLHVVEVLSLRLGFEVGGSAVIASHAETSGLGWALVSQLGVRVADGHFEILADIACDAHEAAVRASFVGTPSWATQPSLRASLLLGAEF